MRKAIVRACRAGRTDTLMSKRSAGSGWLQFGAGMIVAYVVGWLALFAGCTYVIIHFISKYW